MFGVKLGSGSSITIDGKDFKGSNIRITNGEVIVDGVTQEGELVGDINVTVNGDVAELTNTNGYVTAKNVGSIKTTNGNVTCEDVTGDVKTTNGDVRAKVIHGKVNTVNGDIN
jgi:hypothetical protein